MKIRLADLWTWKGTVDRGPYVLLGIGLFLVKYNLDRLLVRARTGRDWIPLHYWTPGDFFGLLTDSPADRATTGLLLLTALPFIWTGVVLTLRRLRSVGWPAGLVVLFFVPLVNAGFFILLSLLPPRTGEGPAGPARDSFIDRFMPRSPLGSASMAVLATAAITAALTAAGAALLGVYGWGVFAGIPFFLGLWSALIYGYRQPRPLGACIAVAMSALTLASVLLLVLAIEGIVCILMSVPFAAAIGLFGAFVGYLLQRRGPAGGRAAPAILLAMPLLLGAEAVLEPDPPLLEARTAVEIDAPPERVWRHVVSFAELPPPEELLFRVGIAYPIRAEIEGRGPGAVRRCVFSTGAFVEPIETWDEPRLLAFGVSSQPPPLEEWTPWPGLRPPHVEGYFLSRRGQFLLEPLPGGRTRLEGTTWYSHRMWPAFYWRLWSDAILHRIHGRVLVHVKRLSEGGP